MRQGHVERTTIDISNTYYKHKATKELSNDIKRLEEKISASEKEINELEKKLADPEIYSDGDLTKELTSKFYKAKSDLENTLKKWETLNEQLFEIKSQFN